MAAEKEISPEEIADNQKTLDMYADATGTKRGGDPRNDAEVREALLHITHFTDHAAQ